VVDQRIIHTVLTNGRQMYLARTMLWASKNVSYDGLKLVGKFIIDDSGDSKYRKWLRDTYPDYLVVEVADTPQGFEYAMNKLWDVVRSADTDFVFHLEDDFLFPDPVSLIDLVSILNENTSMSQVAFKRQPWFANEVAQGGLIQALERNQNVFTDKTSAAGIKYTEHRVLWTANPSVFPKWLIEKYPWPLESWSESLFAKSIFRNPGITSAYYGHKYDEPACIHIGKDKLGRSY